MSERFQRYPSAGALGEDLQRYLDVRKSRILALRSFAGLNTVERGWYAARGWLRSRVS